MESVVIALAFAAALFAQEGTAAPAPQPAAAAEAPKKVCRRETTTGSNMARKVCYTPEELAAREKQGQHSRERMRETLTGRADSELRPQ